MLRVIVKRRFINHLRAKLRSPISVGLPSSRSEKPTSTPDPERVLTHRQIGEQLFAELSPEHQEVFWAVVLSEVPQMATLRGHGCWHRHADRLWRHLLVSESRRRRLANAMGPNAMGPNATGEREERWRGAVTRSDDEER